MFRFFKFLSTSLGIIVLLVATNAQAQSITLYNGGQFSGGSRTLTDSVLNLSILSFNNKASSVRVASGRWELCVDPGFGGRCVIVTADIPGLGALNFNDRISSVRLIPTITTPPPEAPEAPPTGPAAPPHEDIFLAPSDFFFVNTIDGLQLNWWDNSNVDDGFIIERRLPMASSWIRFSTNPDSGPTSGEYMGRRGYTHSNQRSGVGVCYRVIATRGSRRSEPSNIECASWN